jgi:hypothetical protein
MSGVSLRLVRKLKVEHLPENGQALEITDTLASESFRGPDYTVQSFSEGVAYLTLHIPRGAHGVCRGPREALDARGEPFLREGLFYIQCFLMVSTSLGITT